MRIRSKIEIRDEVLRLLHLQDSSSTRAYVEAHSAVIRYPQSGAKAVKLVWELNGELFQHRSYESPKATVTHDGWSLVPYEADDITEVLDDQGGRYKKSKRGAPTNLAGRP
jgi:hypothetical protein